MSLLQNSNAISTAGGYDINNSLRFRRSASAFLQRTPASAGNRKTFTWSGWVKRGLSGNNYIFNANQNSSYGQFGIAFSNNATDDLTVYNQNSTTTNLNVYTNAVFRDYSAWYHIVVVVDTTQATAANRVLIYVNGVLQSTTISTQVAQNTDLNCNNTIAHNIGKEQTASGGSGNYFDGYMAEINFIDGSAKTPSDFGETDTTTGSWKPKAYTGTYGTNGFYLKFSDIATTSGSNAGLGKDFSGNANYWTTNNISVTAGTTYDAMTDSPTLTSATVANYAVLNPLTSTAGYMTYANANLYATIGAQDKVVYGTIAIPTSGKYYFEWTISTVGSATSFGVTTEVTQGTGTGFSGGVQRWYDWKPAGAVANDVLMTAIDMDNGKIWFGKNGTWNSSGNPATGANPAYSDMLTAGGSNPWLAATYLNAANGNANFGQRPFSYTPPTGFVRLNTYNLPDSTIKKGNTVMDATLYTGNGSTQTVTNAAGFKPDWVWLKERSSTSSNNVYDSIRGTTKYLLTNATDAEGTDATSLTAFNSNGFSLGGAGFTNENAQTYVAWQWQAGQGTNTTNTAGTVTSTVSVNTTAGFSIVLYTGNGGAMTMGHGLGVAPKLIILKDRDIGRPWPVYHGSLATNQYLILNTTAAAATSTSYWNNTAPTSTVFSVNGLEGNVGANGEKYVAYCWAEIAGFSKFTSYTGNGSTDGPFVYCGFRPKYVMYKDTANGSTNWEVVDSARNTTNPEFTRLFPNQSNADDNGVNPVMDFTANGFKIRTSAFGANNNGNTHIVMAFAENPLKFSNAR